MQRDQHVAPEHKWWFTKPCLYWPGNCKYGAKCLNLHGAYDNRPCVAAASARYPDVVRPKNEAEFSALKQKLAGYRVELIKSDLSRPKLLPRPEAPAVEASPSEALLKWLEDRFLASKKVTLAFIFKSRSI
jgi:hypothetical protein